MNTKLNCEMSKILLKEAQTHCGAKEFVDLSASSCPCTEGGAWLIGEMPQGHQRDRKHTLDSDNV